MSEIPKIVLPHGGYRNLIVYKKSDIIYQGTVVFCRRFFPMYGDRTVDQMTQAARSCKQNIAEGSAASGTSKETELKLTNVARASLDELREDYLDFIKKNNASVWELSDNRQIVARDCARTHEEWEWWKGIFESRDAVTLANLMIIMINQSHFLLDKLIAFQENDFKLHGGVRERMHASRTAVRAEEWDKGLYSCLYMASNASELARKVVELKQQIDTTARNIAKRKGWCGPQPRQNSLESSPSSLSVR